MRPTTLSIVLLLPALLFVAPPAPARNIDLSTVPDRQTVQLTIYNSEDLTLVRETRKVSFKPGVNPLQFSWANTLIDPTSVELRFLDHPDRLDVLDTTFPHDKPQMLTWNVESDIDGEATVEISYFTSGISWSAEYVVIADEKETEVQLENFVRVTNHSGEAYEDAQIRLIVGKVNLVEKIAELARLPIGNVEKLGEEKRLFRLLDDGAIKIEPNSSVAGWNEHTKYGQRVRNGTGKPIRLEVRRTFQGHVDVRTWLDAKNHDYNTIEYTASVPAGTERELRYEVVGHKGRNKKQDNVTIVLVERKP